MWRTTFSVPAEAQSTFEAVFEDAAALSVLGQGGQVRIDAWTDFPPDRRAVAARVAVAAAAGGVPEPVIEVAKVEEQDWIEATRAAFPPVNIGRFTVYGSHADPPPPGRGLCLTTYMGDGEPLPGFSGDPLIMPLKGGAEEVMGTYWDALDEENRVAIALKSVKRDGGSDLKAIHRF